jgi:hypothetical protein
MLADYERRKAREQLIRDTGASIGGAVKISGTIVRGAAGGAQGKALEPVVWAMRPMQCKYRVRHGERYPVYAKFLTLFGLYLRRHATSVACGCSTSLNETFEPGR